MCIKYCIESIKLCVRPSEKMHSSGSNKCLGENLQHFSCKRDYILVYFVGSVCLIESMIEFSSIYPSHTSSITFRYTFSILGYDQFTSFSILRCLFQIPCETKCQNGWHEPSNRPDNQFHTTRKMPNNFYKCVLIF